MVIKKPSINHNIENLFSSFNVYIKTAAASVAETFYELERKYYPSMSKDLLIELKKFLEIFFVFEIYSFWKILLKLTAFYLLIYIYSCFLQFFGKFRCTEELENRINSFENFFIIIGILLILVTSKYKISKFETQVILKIISEIYTNSELQLIILAFVGIWAYFHKNIRYFFENTLNYKMGSNFKKPSLSLKIVKQIYPATLYSFILITIFFSILPIIISKISKIISTYDFLM